MVYSITYVILIVLSLKYNTGYLPIGIIIVLSILILSLIIWGILRILKIKNVKIFLTIGLICILVLISVFLISRINKTITNNRADLLIKKITEYKNLNGYYPKQLIDLTPNFLNKIPQPAFNFSENFIYEIVDCKTDTSNLVFCENFILKYFGPLEMEAKFSSKKKKWEYDD